MQDTAVPIWLGRSTLLIIADVAIIGGGPGGLFTAYELQRIVDRPLQVTVFEASDRLGGKVQTAQFASAAVRYEVGAAEFYDYERLGHDSLKDLVRELGLPLRPLSGPVVMVDGHPIANVDDVRDRLGPAAAHALLEFDRQARDRMTPREFYQSGSTDVSVAPDPARFDTTIAGISCPQARLYIKNLIHSDLAAEPAQTNVEYGLQNYLMNDPKYMQQYAIDGGNERLMTSLAARLDAAVRLGCRATQVARSPSGRLRVRLQERDVSTEREFDAVVAALPHSAMGQIEFAGSRLSTAIASHQSHHDHPAHYLRVTLLYDRPFWRSRVHGSFWMLDRFGGCCLYDEALRDPTVTHGILGLLLAGDAAREMALAPDEEIVRRVLESLPPSLDDGCSVPIETRVHRWIGAVSAMPGGTHPMPVDRRHCPEPIDHPNLFVVGDYLYDSTLNGVLDSAEYVAAWIAAKVAQDSCP